MKRIILIIYSFILLLPLQAQSPHMHIENNAGPGQYVAEIENLNDDGNGLKIKINGNHGMWIPTGPNDGFFPPAIPEPIDSLLKPILVKIRERILNEGNIQAPTFEELIEILQPGGSTTDNIIEDLGLENLIKSALCAGQEALVELVTLPEIALPNFLPDNIPDIPQFPTMSNTMIDLPNTPDISLSIIPNINFSTFEFDVIGLGKVDVPYSLAVTFPQKTIDLPDLPDITIPAFTPYNNAVLSVNSALTTVNSDLESFLQQVEQIQNTVESFNAASLIESALLDCSDAISFEELIFNFPIPDNAIFDKALDLDNHFITFVDQADRELGSIRALHPSEWIIEEVNTVNALEIASIIPGLFSDDGNIAENIVNLFKLGATWVKNHNAIGVIYKSGFGDYAEWLPRVDINESISYGDIVGIKSGKISKNIIDAEQVMVVSKAPIVMGNAPDPDSVHLGNNVAFIGQVPVKVMGSVASGDFILADKNRPGLGIAKKPSEMAPQDYALVVGKSWEDHSNPGFKYVHTIVGMHQNAWAQPMQNMKNKVAQLQNSQAQLSSDMEMIKEQLQAMQASSSVAVHPKN